jgi:hypothetical protein
MTEPQGDDSQVCARLQQVHGRRVPERVRGDVLAAQGRAALSGGGDGAVEPVPYAGAGQRRAGPVGEDGRLGRGVELVQPAAQFGGSVLP